VSDAAPRTPRPYVRRLPAWWVLTKGSWLLFLLREITSLFVAYVAVLLVVYARSVAAGPEAYEGFVAWTRRPGVVAWHLVVLAAVLWHTVTWFVATPTAIGRFVAGRRVAPAALVAGHYALWLAVSAALWWVLR